MFRKLNSVPSETPNPPNQPTLSSTSLKRFGKKLYAITALIAVVLIAIALLIPQGAAIIPLSLNYQVGEKMIYQATETITGPVGNITNTGSINSSSSLEVTDFDGEYYTLNRTINVTPTTMQESPMSISFIEKINKTGYVRYFLPGETASLFGKTNSNPVLAALISNPEAKVGDSWQIPLNTGNSTIGTTGELTLKFVDIKEITVPAGTYKIFRIDISTNNLSSHIKNSAGTSDTTMSFSGSMYLEYGTCRQIKSDLQISVTIQSTLLNSTISYSAQMELLQHLKP